MIPDETIAEVLERTDLVALIGRHVNLKKAGSLYKGLCPFHDENTPSFTVSPTRNTYHCFGCGAHGHSIKFLMEVGARSFPEAVKELAAECGVEVPEQRPESPEDRQKREEKKSLERRLLDAQDALTGYYSDQLFGPSGDRARRYLAQRGLSRRSAEAFRLGWASGDKRAFSAFLERHQLTLDDMVKLGVVMEPNEGWTESRPLRGGYLRFRERLMFPVVDFRGDVTGYSGRILDNNKKIAKYMNSPESPVFTKGQQLYGAFTARSAARKAGRVVLVEGNIDVVALWDKGLEGTVAAMGTALTPEQVRLVKRLNSNAVCVMDGDAAGEKAAFSSLEPFLDAGIQPRAVMMPDGSDPDSFVQANGIEAFNALLDSAAPLMDILIKRQADIHPDDPPGRLAALREVVPALSKLTDALSKDLYISQIETQLGLSSEIIRSALAEVKSPKPGRGGPPLRQEPRPGPNRAPPPDYFYPEAQNGPYTGKLEPIPESFSPSIPESFFLPGYVSQILVFIVQFPFLAQRMHATGCHKYLTQPGLIAFFHSLYGEVSVGRTPNIDQILSGLGDPQATAYLRGLQALPLIVESEVVETAFDDAMLRLQRGALEADRSRLNREIKGVFYSNPIRCAELNEELNRVRAALSQLSAVSAKGAG